MLKLYLREVRRSSSNLSGLLSPCMPCLFSNSPRIYVAKLQVWWQSSGGNWNSGDNKRKIPWVAWQKLCGHKDKGEVLGFMILVNSTNNCLGNRLGGFGIALTLLWLKSWNTVISKMVISRIAPLVLGHLMSGVVYYMAESYSNWAWISP